MTKVPRARAYGPQLLVEARFNIERHTLYTYKKPTATTRCVNDTILQWFNSHAESMPIRTNQSNTDRWVLELQWGVTFGVCDLLNFDWEFVTLVFVYPDL